MCTTDSQIVPESPLLNIIIVPYRYPPYDQQKKPTIISIRLAVHRGGLSTELALATKINQIALKIFQ